MKLVSKPLCLLLASAALTLAGCTKKPIRPISTDTTPQMGSGGLPITSIDTQAPGTDLMARTDDWNTDGQNRAALATSTVYFDLDQFAIKQSEREKLKLAKEYLDKNPTHRLILEGHCDWRGTAEYNLSLGDRRASAVKKYLLSLGVVADKVETLSKGSLDAAKGDEAAMAKDRRVDIIVSRAK